MFVDLRENVKERERNIDVREKYQLVASHVYLNQGSNLQHRYVPWMGIKYGNFWCMGQFSNQLNYPGKGYIHDFSFSFFKILFIYF